MRLFGWFRSPVKTAFQADAEFPMPATRSQTPAVEPATRYLPPATLTPVPKFKKPVARKAAAKKMPKPAKKPAKSKPGRKAY